MDQPQPQPIAEGDVVLIRARVRKIWGDSVVVRIAIRDGSSAYHQLSVPPGSVVGRALAQDPAAVLAAVPAIDQV